MNIKLSKREKILLLAAVLTAIVLLGIKFLILPAADEYRSNAMELVKSSMQVDAAKIQLAETKSIAEKLNDEYKEANAAASSLLPPIDKPTLNVWLVNIAKNSGLTVGSVKISDPVAANPGYTPSEDKSTNTSSSAASSEVQYNLKTFAEIAKGNATSSQSSNADTSSSNKSSSGVALYDAEMVRVEINATGSYQNIKDFLDAIKSTNKYIVINSFNCDGEGNNMTFKIVLECYEAEKLVDDNTFKWELPATSGQQDLM